MLSQGGKSTKAELEKIRTMLSEYFFEESIVSFIEIIMSDYRVQKNILNVMGIATNTSVKNLFKLKLKDPDNGNKYRYMNKLNVKGLLNAALMNGNKVEQIGVKAISLMYTRLAMQAKEGNKSEKHKKDIQSWEELSKIVEKKRKISHLSEKKV